MTQRITASTFRAKCLSILDQVNETREGVIVTKRGKPVAMIVPLEASLRGIARGDIIYAAEDDRFSTGEAWEADG